MPRRKPKNRGGRPTRFTIGTAVALAAALSRGQTPEAAAKSSGLGSSTVFRWLALGRAGDPRFAALAELAKEAEKDRKARRPGRGRKRRGADPFGWRSFRGFFETL